MSCIFTRCILMIGFGALTAHAQFGTPAANTTGCFHPHCSLRTCPELRCTGGLVVDNESCPCCYNCARQRDEECDAETENDYRPYRYCDTGLVCRKAGDDGTGRVVGRCVGDRVQRCVNGRQHRKGCLICSCIDGAETCVRDDTIMCPPIHQMKCPNGNRPYRPVDKCCFVCSERSPLHDAIIVPPYMQLLGQDSDFRAKYGGRLSVVFHVAFLDEPSASLSVNNSIGELDLTNDHYSLSVRVIRLVDNVFSSIFYGLFEIIFSIEKVMQTDSGVYKLVAKNEFGVSEATFRLKVIRRKLQNCSFEEDTCDWANNCNGGGNGIGWLRRSGPTSTHGTGPQAGDRGSGYYLYLETSIPTRVGDKVCLQSPLKTSRRHPKTLRFAYHMSGSEVGCLTVKQMLYPTKPVVVKPLWTLCGDQGDQWHTAKVSVGPIRPYRRSRIVFEATSGGSLGDIAIDSFEFHY